MGDLVRRDNMMIKEVRMMLPVKELKQSVPVYKFAGPLYSSR